MMEQLSRFFLIKLFILVLFFQNYSYAKPSYAARQGVINCSACHYSPSGGGPRNIYGKSFGARNLKMGKYSKSGLYTVDIRGIGYFPTKDTSKKINGFGLMSSLVGGSVPVVETENGSSTRLVMAYDFGQFSRTLRDTFVRQDLSNDSFLFDQVIVGRFQIPFGLLTDEHRTYTKIQAMTIAQKYEFGVMASGNPNYYIHYDLALGQGFKTGGDLISAKNGIVWGLTSNLRVKLYDSPFFLGVSGNYNKNSLADSPWAAVLYGGVGSENILNTNRGGSLIIEVVKAKYFNDSSVNSKIATFVNATSSPTYYGDILKKESLGIYMRADLDLTAHWLAFFKWDALALDSGHLKDNYQRFGAGLKYRYNAHATVGIRYELANIGRDGIAETKVAAAEDMVLLTMYMWL